ncbi:MAG: hypothetical protein R3F54_01585 [Alphaproteobacteria bacterium]
MVLSIHMLVLANLFCAGNREVQEPIRVHRERNDKDQFTQASVAGADSIPNGP